MPSLDLEHCTMLLGLSPQEKERIISLAETRLYQPGEHLIEENHPHGQLFLILKGEVQVKATTGDQREEVLLVLGPGQVVGEIELLDNGPPPATVEATQPTRVLAFPGRALLDFCAAHPHIGYRLMRNLAESIGFKIRYHNLSLR